METAIVIHSQNILRELATHQSLYAHLDWQKFVTGIVMTFGLYNGKFNQLGRLPFFQTPHLFNASMKIKRWWFPLFPLTGVQHFQICLFLWV